MAERMSLSPTYLSAGYEKTWCESILTDRCDDVTMVDGQVEAWTCLACVCVEYGSVPVHVPVHSPKIKQEGPHHPHDDDTSSYRQTKAE
jgi:hypothetical protein